MKPILRGRNIRRYQTQWDDEWLIDVHNGYESVLPIEIDDYCEIKKYLKNFYPNLENRQDKGNTPYHLRNCAYHANFKEEKIVWSDISTHPNFALASDGVFINNTAYMIIGVKQYYLLGILNSNITKYFIQRIATTLGGKGNRYFKLFVEKIPIPELTSVNLSLVSQVEALAKELSKSKISARNNQSKDLEYETNYLSYKLFELTNSEIKIIERFDS